MRPTSRHVASDEAKGWWRVQFTCAREARGTHVRRQPTRTEAEMDCGWIPTMSFLEEVGFGWESPVFANVYVFFFNHLKKIFTYNSKQKTLLKPQKTFYEYVFFFYCKNFWQNRCLTFTFVWINLLFKTSEFYFIFLKKKKKKN